MRVAELPAWLVHLEDEEHQFIKRFLLASGSLKDLATAYDVSYPTIRLRLDRLLDRIRSLDQTPPADEFDARIRVLVANDEISTSVAKDLLRVHNRVVKGVRK